MIVFALGTRPEIIKLAPVIRECRRRGVPFKVLHTGQHYDDALDAAFFAELELPTPDANLGVGSGPAVEQLAMIVARSAALALDHWQPEWVVVHGDTNSTLGVALAAHKLEIPVAHVEAGLRSHDWRMPEEGNRALVGRLASLHLCPLESHRTLLASEGIERGVHVVGNTIADAVYANLVRARESNVFRRLGFSPNTPYALVTMHRPSNVDHPGRLAALVEALTDVAESRDLRLVWPMHPRVRYTSSSMRDRWSCIAALPYLDMLALLSSARAVFTDSGGIQEEACILGVPCVTLRTTTERRESLDCGASALCADASADRLEAALASVGAGWQSPYGDGQASSRIVDLLVSRETGRRPSGERL